LKKTLKSGDLIFVRAWNNIYYPAIFIIKRHNGWCDIIGDIQNLELLRISYVYESSILPYK